MKSWPIRAVATLSSIGALSVAASADPGSTFVAQVEAQTIMHAGDRLRVHVPEAAVYVGADRFLLGGVADCEVHVFVEADEQHRVRKLYWVQFESYLPSQPDRRYNYADGNRRMELNGVVTWARAVPANVSEPPRPGSDRERVIALLRQAGLIPPSEILSVRLVQLLDDPQGMGHGRRELMMMYVEDLAPSGVNAADFVTDGAPNSHWTAAEPALLARGMAAFRVERH